MKTYVISYRSVLDNRKKRQENRHPHRPDISLVDAHAVRDRCADHADLPSLPRPLDALSLSLTLPCVVVVRRNPFGYQEVAQGRGFLQEAGWRGVWGSKAAYQTPRSCVRNNSVRITYVKSDGQ